jgi:type VI secretion system secreted protein VgrG
MAIPTSSTSSTTSTSSTSSTTYINVTVTPDPGFKLVFDSMTATEALGRPFLYELQMSSLKAQGELMSLLGSSVTVSITLPDNSKRYFNGIVARLAYAGLRNGAFSYRIELRPWIWLLSRTQDCQIFQNMSAFAIITQIFQNAGFSDFQDNRQNQAGSTELEFCVQYRETAFDFVTRLMEEWGLYYFFQHADGKHTLVICDDPNSHASVGAAIPFQADQTELRAVEDHIWQWSSELMVMPGKFTYRDYNFTTPTADLTTRSTLSGSHTYGTLEVYDYPGPYDTTDHGQTLADVRMQDLNSRRQILYGTSNSRRLYTGCKFTMSKFYQDSENIEYTVIGATYTLSMAEGSATTAGQMRDTFRCTFQAIKGSTNFQLNRQTPRPMIRGPQTAKVVGASGDEITTDQYGRVKVKFYWDRSTTQDENSSCWIRVAQVWAAASWGAIFIPRVGQEVVVEFLEGNPDRPIITGCVYNANNTVPYGLPDNKTRSTIKTNSSTGGGGFNEIRFEDKAGSEEVFFQAQKDYNKTVKNNETVTITQDTTTTVQQGNRSITVSQGNNSLTVSQGNNSVTVSQGNDSLTVSTGNHSITVSSGSSTVSAAQSITLKVGSNSITISTTGITMNGGQISATASESMSLDGGGEMTLTAGEIGIN